MLFSFFKLFTFYISGIHHKYVHQYIFWNEKARSATFFKLNDIPLLVFDPLIPSKSTVFFLLSWKLNDLGLWKITMYTHHYGICSLLVCCFLFARQHYLNYYIMSFNFYDICKETVIYLLLKEWKTFLPRYELSLTCVFLASWNFRECMLSQFGCGYFKG